MRKRAFSFQLLSPAPLTVTLHVSRRYGLSDCRNQTSDNFNPDGKLRVLSWHIHFTTNSTDFNRFYEAFVAEFRESFPPDGLECPFGPNFGVYLLSDWLLCPPTLVSLVRPRCFSPLSQGLNTYEYICCLDMAPEEKWALELARAFEAKHGVAGPRARSAPIPGARALGDPWSTPQVKRGLQSREATVAVYGITNPHARYPPARARVRWPSSYPSLSSTPRGPSR